MNANQLIEQSELRQSFIMQGLATVRNYDGNEIARRYCKEIYAPLLATLKQ